MSIALPDSHPLFTPPPDMAKREIRLITESFAYRPALDTAVSRAILQRVSDGAEPETLRLYRPGAVVAFGPQDVRAPGYRQAVRAARLGGFEAVRRLAGGRAAVFHQETVAFAWTLPDPAPRANVDERFEELSRHMAVAFRRLGIDANVGEVPGEYCPGRYSVNARGRKKLMGVGQRIIARASHVGGVVVVRGSQRVRDILLPVYDALQVRWDPATVGSIEDELGTVGYGEVQRVILDEFASLYDLFDGSLAADTQALAESIESEHVAP